MKEGLSYSDYFSDQVPYEVKPVHNLTPMEEQDYPIQAKNLFGGLWEDDKENNKNTTTTNDFKYIGYHGTGKIFKRFNLKNSTQNLLYFTDNKKEIEDGNSGANSNSIILKCELTIKNPCSWKEYDKLGISEIKSLGFDGIILPGKTLYSNEPETTYIVFSPKQVKIINRIKLKENLNIKEEENKKEDYSGMWPNDINSFKLNLSELFSYLKKQLKLKTIPKVKLISDKENADNIFGKTAYYNPQNNLMALYITRRHQKDILRSFSHECVHLHQYENNLFDIKNQHDTSSGYAQKNKNLRKAEKHAYMEGNIIFRDWEDLKKNKQ